MTEPVFNKIAIIGAGLIGASIARAAVQYGAAGTVSLYDSSEDVRQRAAGIALGDVADNLATAVAEADCVFLCVPVGALQAVAADAVPLMKAGAVLTDVGSVKGQATEALAAAADGRVHIIPGHPIAGTEQSGPEAGFPTLFQNAWHILTPLADGDDNYDAAVSTLEAFWTQQGEVVKYSAGGFRDFTRIAASDPVMWRDVFLNNKDAVLECLGRFSEDLAALQRAIRWGDGETLFNEFNRARSIRKAIIDAGQDSGAVNFGRNLPKGDEDEGA